MQASGAVCRVRQARIKSTLSAERGCPHESRRRPRSAQPAADSVAGTAALVDYRSQRPVAAIYTAEDCRHANTFLLDSISTLESPELTKTSPITVYLRQRATRARFRCAH
jgi:hypothetical protein